MDTIAYTPDGCPQTLTTPYGVTTFNYLYGADYRWVDVTEPNGGRQVYAYKDDVGAVIGLWSGVPWLPKDPLPANLLPDPNILPPGTLLDNNPNGTITGIGGFDSFHWDQLQSVGLPSDPNLVTTNQMNKARTRHWLQEQADESGKPDFALSIQMDPCPTSDGTSWGQLTWFGYPGQSSAGTSGTSVQPTLVARRLPDGSTWYESYQRNVFGKVTSKTSTYGIANPPATRTYTYVYDPNNNQDLLQVFLPGSEQVSSYTYNSRHQVLTETQWPDDTHPYTSTWAYDAYGNVQTQITSAGLTRTYTYNASSGNYSGYLSGISDSPIARTESFTWLDGNIWTFTDARGLQVTYSYDGLNRLTETDYPTHDGLAASSIVYSYALQPGHGFNTGGGNINILEVTKVTDRLGKVTYYDRDQLGRLTTIKDPLGHTNFYTYCGCGGVESSTDGRGKITNFDSAEKPTRSEWGYNLERALAAF